MSGWKVSGGFEKSKQKKEIEGLIYKAREGERASLRIVIKNIVKKKTR